MRFSLKDFARAALNRKVRRVHWSQKFSFSHLFCCFRYTEPMGQMELLGEARESTCSYGTQQGRRGMKSSASCLLPEQREKQPYFSYNDSSRKGPADQLICIWIRHTAKSAVNLSVGVDNYGFISYKVKGKMNPFQSGPTYLWICFFFFFIFEKAYTPFSIDFCHLATKKLQLYICIILTRLLKPSGKSGWN